jgi:pseudouridine synthase
VIEDGERLQKVLARAGIGSRRAAEQLIAAGRVTVNGAPARLGQRVDISKDKVEVDGSLIPVAEGIIYYLMNKPPGYVTTASDPQGRPTVLDLVDSGRRVWPVGRLDADSEGALILTNDGDLTLRLTHPRFKVPKTYLAQVEGNVGGAALRRLARGVSLEDGHTAPAEVALVERVPGGALLEITIREGRNRQVRRMGDAVGHPVKRLVRTAIGPLQLGRLKPGSYRKLAPLEVQLLYRDESTSG